MRLKIRKTNGVEDFLNLPHSQISFLPSQTLIHSLFYSAAVILRTHRLLLLWLLFLLALSNEANLYQSCFYFFCYCGFHPRWKWVPSHLTPDLSKESTRTTVDADLASSVPLPPVTSLHFLSLIFLLLFPFWYLYIWLRRSGWFFPDVDEFYSLCDPGKVWPRSDLHLGFFVVDFLA